MTTNFNDSQNQRKLPIGFIHNLQVNSNATTPNSKLDVAAGECRDSTDSIDMALAAGVTIDATIVGVNGIDTGALAASTQMYVYLLNDTQGILDPCCIVSASATAPVIPTVNGITYDAVRIIDYWMTDSFSHFLKGYTYGAGSDRTRRWDTSVATAVTAGASQTLAAIVLTPGVPPIAGCRVLLEAIFTPNAAGDKCSFTPFGSTATVMQRVTGQVAAVAISQEIEVGCPLNAGVPTTLYINSAASGALNALINGYRFSL